MNSFIREERYSTNINYFLETENIFYEVGYKVLRNKENSGFIKCNKVIHNGKIKLVYNTSKYKNLEEVIINSSVDTVITVINKLMRVAISVKDNGFIEYKNIISNLKNIFVDENNLNVYFIYLPIVNTDRTDKMFIDEIKRNILKVMDFNSYLRGVQVNNLRFNLTTNKTLEEILYDMDNTSNKNIVKTIDNKGLMIDSVSKSIALKGINTPIDINILIDKERYLIGSSREYADGVITFNKAISRRHSMILKEMNDYYIVDVGSANGTYLNGVRINKNIKMKIKNGDIIKIANSEFRIIEIV